MNLEVRYGKKAISEWQELLKEKKNELGKMEETIAEMKETLEVKTDDFKILRKGELDINVLQTDL